MKKVTLEMIQEARNTISDIINITPIIESPKMNEKTGANVFLKCENLQKDVCLYYHIGECLGYCKKEIEQNKEEMK